MKRLGLVLTSISLGVFPFPAFSQGTFLNLDFESANLPNIPPGQVGSLVPVGLAIPGWTAYEGLNPSPVEQISHNGVSLGGPSIIIHGPGDTFGILQGRYSVQLVGGPGLAAIGQSGTIPIDSRSLTFLGDPNATFQVSFVGQAIPFTRVKSLESYNVYAADVSGFAGQSGELRFTATANAFGGAIDDVQFSTQVVPEPQTLAILLGGFLFFCVKLRRAGSSPRNE